MKDMTNDGLYRKIKYPHNTKVSYLNKYRESSSSVLEAYIGDADDAPFFSKGGHADSNGHEESITSEEIDWLERCIKAGELVSRIEVVTPGTYAVGDLVWFFEGYDTLNKEIPAIIARVDNTYNYIVELPSDCPFGWHGQTDKGLSPDKRYWSVHSKNLKRREKTTPPPTLDPSVFFPFSPAELLEYAKKTYPVGTTFIDCNMKRKVTVKDNGVGDIYSQGALSGDPYILVNTDGGYEYLLLDRKWAEVVTATPTATKSIVFTMTRAERLAHAKKLFPVGTTFRSPQNGNIYVVHKIDDHTYREDDNWVMANVVEDDLRYEYLFLTSADPQWATVVAAAPPSSSNLEEVVVGQYIEALVDRPQGGLVKKGEFGRVTKLKPSYDDSRNLGAYVDFPNHSGYSISFVNDKYRAMPVGWTPPVPKGSNAPEGIYGKFSDPLRASTIDAMMGIPRGAYITTVDLYDASKVAQMATLVDPHYPHSGSWYAQQERALEADLKSLIAMSPFLNKSEKKATILPLDSYTQQPLIIKQNSKIKTLKIA